MGARREPLVLSDALCSEPRTLEGKNFQGGAVLLGVQGGTEPQKGLGAFGDVWPRGGGFSLAETSPTGLILQPVDFFLLSEAPLAAETSG